jgi:ubiquinone/menaquinone biosynthesis C-methylase UbiE
MAEIIRGNVLLDINLVLDKAQISEGMKVADLGCGAYGHFVFPLAILIGKKGIIYAVDILKTALESISRKAKQENLNNVRTVWSDVEVFNATKIDSGSLDVALLVNTLHLSHKRAEILREAIRMVKKGGKIVVVEWKNIALPFGPPVEDRVNRGLLERAAKKLGLDLIEEYEAGRYHYGLIFRKM